ncbi:hypothetical protein N781_05745 [Pontibacillus halophilus JSM 076056 = DSM 19796]|uniref:Metallo-beta-lactamase domain-containing protein n=1 Tax=Pontibacillus halophilus JSM 076056 = DSM 19796 TaxID=1385510 RepID=A0A0A5GIC1_9BACI|nr:MBL fold metallo-hydrolase [Pontibacillus halophilus]KGX90875.1 hypothetical protein N781_05745 [Pontibacillus halophilus JSM 076056 = DSM 19796]
MDIEQLPLGPLGTNCYLVHHNHETLIIDPGSEPDKLKRMIERRGLSPIAILLTHAHFDHIGALEGVRGEYNIPVYVHELEKDWLKDPKLNGSALFPMATSEIVVEEANHYLQPGELHIGSFQFEVVHTPGHSPGSVSLIFHDSEFVIAGDTLFQRGIGRTDLPGGDMDTLITSINNELLSLRDSYTVYPGHGPATTIEAEKVQNPFL